MRHRFSWLPWVLLLGLGMAAEAATVSGTVSAAGSGQPIAGAAVTLSRWTGWSYETLGTATTNGQGEYAISNAYVGSAIVKANANGFLPLESPASMPAGNGVVAVNLALPLSATIAGHVADEVSGTALAGKTVRAHSSATQFLYTDTAADGSYAFTGLPPGSYSVCVMDHTDAYMNQCWDHATANSLTFATNFTPVNVAAGDIRNGIDFDLRAGAHISGVILNRRTGLPPAPSPNLQILLRTAAATFVQLRVQLDGNGRYRIDGLAPGSYQAIAQSNSPYYTSQLYAGIDCVDASCNYPNGNTIVIDAALTSVDHVDFSLAPGGRLQGRVLDRVTQAPIVDATVELWRRGPTPFRIGTAQTDGQGDYVLDHIDLTPHLVVVRSSTHIAQRYPDVPCFIDCTSSTQGDFSVPLNATIDLDTMLLDRGTTISGQARLPGLSATTYAVNLFRAPNESLGSVVADATGAYRFPAWMTGTYFVMSSGGPQCQLFRQLPCSLAPINSTPIVLAAPGDSFTADFDLFVDDIHRASFESGQ